MNNSSQPKVTDKVHRAWINCYACDKILRGWTQGLGCKWQERRNQGNSEIAWTGKKRGKGEALEEICRNLWK